ncbi:hypothetical protein BC939DRAFT_473933 [Gamsiella multidivaricata]|uniref:uncharacterized protein n=1 Tax=Gamsiella multidivaricata TaxID=101098 RepID=UPI00221F5128|nr:uncharacterized protein BC939DRAFT_473933 [Gamsiella multidivaricata]KAI7829723.1 hypothetical protein BC939DRAFT_473933 [Gamsiella multidivaricata]
MPVLIVKTENNEQNELRDIALIDTNGAFDNDVVSELTPEQQRQRVVIIRVNRLILLYREHHSRLSAFVKDHIRGLRILVSTHYEWNTPPDHFTWGNIYEDIIEVFVSNFPGEQLPGL